MPAPNPTDDNPFRGLLVIPYRACQAKAAPRRLRKAGEDGACRGRFAERDRT